MIINFSRSEGSPKALIEGIACGCFPIVSDIKAHIDIIEDLKYGTIIKFPNLQKISSKEYDFDLNKNFNKKYSLKSCVKNESKFMKE